MLCNFPARAYVRLILKKILPFDVYITLKYLFIQDAIISSLIYKKKKICIVNEEYRFRSLLTRNCSVQLFICCGPAEDVLLVHQPFLWAFKGISNAFLPRGAVLSSLTCQNDRVPTSNTEQQPLHNIHSGSKHVCGSSVSLTLSCRSIPLPHTCFQVAFWRCLLFATEGFDTSNQLYPPRIHCWH